MNVSRRRFFQTATVAAASAAAVPVVAESGAVVPEAAADARQQYFDAYYFKEASGAFRFESPFDGGILQEGIGYPILGAEVGADGVRRLRVHVAVRASGVGNVELLMPDGTAVPTQYVAGCHMASVLLEDRVTVLTARGRRNGAPVEITSRAIWAKNAFKRYQCYIDDHSFCFRDILQKQYASIFDCFYFEKLRELHRRYKTKVVLNCFYSTPERDFDLSMFPDRYKSEFEDNAEWLRLAFHSENEFPDEPYRDAPPEKLAADFDLVAGQLRRIAGKAYTTGLQIHWATVRPDTYHVLAERGVKMLPTGGSKHPGTGGKFCDFNLPNEITAYLRENQGWMDPKSGIIFFNGKMGTTCEHLPVGQTEAIQHQKLDNPRQNLLLNVAGHEQYWWPFYRNFVPDIFERWDASLRHVTEHGYRPIWIDDGFFGGCE